MLKRGETKASPDQNQILYLEELSLVLNRVNSIQDILPVLPVIPELPAAILQLPANSVRQLISSAAARTVRRVFL